MIKRATNSKPQKGILRLRVYYRTLLRNYEPWGLIQGTIEMQNNILRLPQTIQKTGLSRSTIYSLVARGEFPPKIQLSTRSIGFLESEVNDWIENKLSQRA